MKERSVRQSVHVSAGARPLGHHYRDLRLVHRERVSGRVGVPPSANPLSVVVEVVNCGLGGARDSREHEAAGCQGGEPLRALYGRSPQLNTKKRFTIGVIDLYGAPQHIVDGYPSVRQDCHVVGQQHLAGAVTLAPHDLGPHRLRVKHEYPSLEWPHVRHPDSAVAGFDKSDDGREPAGDLDAFRAPHLHHLELPGVLRCNRLGNAAQQHEPAQDGRQRPDQALHGGAPQFAGRVGQPEPSLRISCRNAAARSEPVRPSQ